MKGPQKNDRKHEWENIIITKPKAEKIPQLNQPIEESSALLLGPQVDAKPQGKRGPSPRKTEVREEKKATLAEPVVRHPSPDKAAQSRKRKAAAVRQESPARPLEKDKSGEVKQSRPTDSENDHLLDLVDQLEDEVKRTAESMANCTQEMTQMQEAFSRLAREGTVAIYFDQMAMGLQRELGDKAPHSTHKLTTDSRMDEIYQTEDSVNLQKSAQHFSDKIEIIGMNIINLKKWQKGAISQIFDLESKCKHFIKLDYFRSEHETYEKRMREFVMEQLGVLQESLNQHKEQIKKTEVRFEEKVNNNQKDTLWKIKETEELMKQRISEVKVNDMCQKLEQKLSKEVRNTDSKLQDKLAMAQSQLTQEISSLQMFTQDKHKDLKNVVQEQIDMMADRVNTLQFHELEKKVDQHKALFDDENDLMQKYLKELKDKMGEQTKQYDDTMQQIQTNTQKINLNRNMIQHLSKSKAKVEPACGHALGPTAQVDSALSVPGAKNTEEEESSPGFHSSLTIGGGAARKRMQLDLQKASEVMGPDKELSRKAKAEMIDAQLRQLEQNLGDVEDSLNQLFDHTSELMPLLKSVDTLKSQKISKDEIKEYLPSEESQIQLITMICRKELEPIQTNLQRQLESWDAKMVKMRRDFNINSINSQLDKKAGKAEVLKQLQEHQILIDSTKDSFMMFTDDFTAVLVEFNSMKRKISELDLIRDDVLIGKRNTNCISCSKANDGFQQIKHVTGNDGRLYLQSGMAKEERGAGREGHNASQGSSPTLMKSHRSKSPKARRHERAERNSLLDDLLHAEMSAKQRNTFKKYQYDTEHRTSIGEEGAQSTQDKSGELHNRANTMRSSSAMMVHIRGSKNNRKMSAHQSYGIKSNQISIGSSHGKPNAQPTGRKLPLGYLVQNQMRQERTSQFDSRIRSVLSHKSAISPGQATVGLDNALRKQILGNQLIGTQMQNIRRPMTGKQQQNSFQIQNLGGAPVTNIVDKHPESQKAYEHFMNQEQHHGLTVNEKPFGGPSPQPDPVFSSQHGLIHDVSHTERKKLDTSVHQTETRGSQNYGPMTNQAPSANNQLNPQSSILIKINSSKLGLPGSGEGHTLNFNNESPLNICQEANLDYINEENIVISHMQ